MTKEKAITHSIAMLRDMAKMFKRAKISSKGVQLLVKRMEREDVKASFKHLVHSNLCAIYTINFPDYTEAWMLVSEETWAFYDMMGFEGHREQNILAESLKSLKEAWKNMPTFRKDDHAKRKVKAKVKSTD